MIPPSPAAALLAGEEGAAADTPNTRCIGRVLLRSGAGGHVKSLGEGSGGGGGEDGEFIKGWNGEGGRGGCTRATCQNMVRKLQKDVEDVRGRWEEEKAGRDKALNLLAGERARRVQVRFRGALIF